MSALLLQPLVARGIHLKNRIILAPLTRSRATGADGRTPNDLMKEYYVQRASAGLIITEATSITPMGVGYANTPGIWSQAHIDGWKNITDAVHAAGGKIVMQLWHVGRVSDPQFLNGARPVSSSAIAPDGHVSIVRPLTPFVVPRAFELNEISEVVAAYRKGAENAKHAGFDGVELHGANGYLLDQFLQDNSNHRTDKYGGSVANRARLMLEACDAAISVWDADRVGMHLSPRGGAHSMHDSNPELIFSYVAEQLGNRKIAFICAREFVGPDSLGPQLKRLFRGAYFGNENFSFESAEASIEKRNIDAVAFGKTFLANPDLVKRYETHAKLNIPNPATFYAAGSVGYTDYPSLGQVQ